MEIKILDGKLKWRCDMVTNKHTVLSKDTGVIAATKTGFVTNKHTVLSKGGVL